MKQTTLIGSGGEISHQKKKGMERESANGEKAWERELFFGTTPSIDMGSTAVEKAYIQERNAHISCDY